MKFSNKNLRGKTSLKIPEKEKLSDYQKAMITAATSSSPHHAAMRILEKKQDKPVLRAGLDVEFSLPDGTKPRGKIAKVLDNGNHVLIASKDLTTYKVPSSRVSVSKDAMKQMVKSAFVQQKFQRCGDLQYDQGTGYYYATISSFYSPSDRDIFRYASHEFEGYEVIDALNKNNLITLVLEKTAQKVSSELEDIVNKVLDHLTNVNPGLKFALKSYPAVRDNCITASFNLLSEDDEAVFVNNGKFTKEASSTVARGKVEIDESGYHATLLNAPFHVYGLLHEEDKTAENGDSGEASTGWSEFSEEDLKEEATPGGRVLPLVKGLTVGKTFPIVKGKPAKKKAAYDTSDGPLGTIGDNDEHREDHQRQADDDPCWDGYEQVGMKDKGGKEVPNCVPKKDGFIDLTAEDEEGEETDPNAVKPPKDTDTDKHFSYDALDQYGEQVYERYLKDAPDFTRSITDPSTKKSFAAAVTRSASKHEGDIRALNGNMVDFVTALSFASIVKMAEKRASPEHAVDEATAEILKDYLGDLGDYYAKINSNIKRYAKHAFKCDGVNLDNNSLDLIVSVINARSSRKAHRKTAQLGRWLDNLGRGKVREEIENLDPDEMASTALEQSRFFPEIEDIINKGIINYLRKDPEYMESLFETMGDDIKYDALTRAVSSNSRLRSVLQAEMDKMLSKQETGYKRTWSDLPSRAIDKVRDLGRSETDREVSKMRRQEDVRDSMSLANQKYKERKKQIQSRINQLREQYRSAPVGSTEQRKLFEELNSLQGRRKQLEENFRKEVNDIKNRGQTSPSPEEEFFEDDVFSDFSPIEESPSSEPDLDLTNESEVGDSTDPVDETSEPSLTEEDPEPNLEEETSESEPSRRREPTSKEERQRIFDESRENINRPVSEDVFPPEAETPAAPEEVPVSEEPAAPEEVPVSEETPKTPKKRKRKNVPKPEEIPGAWSSRGKPRDTSIKSAIEAIANKFGIDEKKASEIRKDVLSSLRKWSVEEKVFYDEDLRRTNLMITNPNIGNLLPEALDRWSKTPKGKEFMSTLLGDSSSSDKTPPKEEGKPKKEEKSRSKSKSTSRKKKESPKSPSKEEKEDEDLRNQMAEGKKGLEDLASAIRENL